MSTTTAEFRTLDAADRLPEDHINARYLEDLRRRVAVARVGGRLPAIDDLCAHGACPPSSGLLTGSTLMCRCHGSQLHIRTGAVVRGPDPLTTYEVRELDGEIQVRV